MSSSPYVRVPTRPDSVTDLVVGMPRAANLTGKVRQEKSTKYKWGSICGFSAPRPPYLCLNAKKSGFPVQPDQPVQPRGQWYSQKVNRKDL